MFNSLWFSPPPGAAPSRALLRGLRFRYGCTILAAVWTTAYLVLYVWASVNAGIAPQWLYVLNLIAPIVLLVLSLRSTHSRGFLQIAALLLGIATVLGVTWLGLFLAPMVVITLIAARRPFHP